MKRKIFYTVILSLMFILPRAFAETVEGEIKAVNPDGASVVINTIDPKSEQKEKKDLTVESTANTEFTGIDSLKDLRSGDFIRADGNRDGKKFKADSISISKVDIKNIQ
jgi:hypothetical protein